ncbi:MAG: hypothetical protein QUS09_06055 [Methanotrichaceae archaeon]|nr:hypothetical protein [Methanotrichaceae archaeon]
MDPDTSKKVSDLLDLMEDMSSDVDAKSGLAVLTEKIKSLEGVLAALTRRFDQFEKMYIEKNRQVKSIKEDLMNLMPDKK